MNQDRVKRAENVLRDERAWLQCGPDDPLSALCLSGGGIRSATFCLGVLQALAQKGMLDRFHYLSTVSGGGYIGSWLSAWIAREKSQRTVIERLGSDRRQEEPQPVRRLRAYTNYLSPTWGLSGDFLVLVAIFMRNLVLNWLVLVPLLIAASMLPRLQLAMVNVTDVHPLQYYALLAAATGLLVWALAYAISDLPGTMPQSPPPSRFVTHCFVPLLASAVIFSWLIAWSPVSLLAARWPGDIPAPTFLFLAGGCLHMLAVEIGSRWRKRRGLDAQPRSVFERCMGFIAGGLGGLLLYGFVQALPASQDRVGREWFVTWSVPLLLVVCWAGSAVYAALTSRHKGEEEREWASRATAWWLGAALVWLAAAVLVIEAPRLVYLWLIRQDSIVAPIATGTLAVLLGAAASAAGFWSKVGSTLQARAATLMQASGLRLVDVLSIAFVIASLVAASIAASCTLRLVSRLPAGPSVLERHIQEALASEQRLADAGLKPEAAAKLAEDRKQGKPADAHVAARAHVAYSVVLERSTPEVVFGAMLVFGLFGLFFSRFVGVNTFSLHSMYGNRLTRAYLGASNDEGKPHWFTGFNPKDSVKLKDGAVRAPGEAPRLFHVVNVALNIVQPQGDRLEWQQRMAAPFTMTPLHCGSDLLGYAPTREYGGPDGGMSWARAMAISGAAASPNMGYHTSKVVAFVMTLFNVRLGWWMPSPSADKKQLWHQREPGLGIVSLLDELLASASERRDYVYLSDGGHFDNLGLYEMIRRRCKRILVIDAGCDPECEFADLEIAIRQARIDFGAVISPTEPLPTLAGAKASKRYIARFRIAYRADGNRPEEEGELVYLKPVLTGEEPLDVQQFAAQHGAKGKAFPHQPTSDQFFDEAQFESYRILGKHAVESHFKADWDNWLGEPAQAQAPAQAPAAPAATAATAAIRTQSSDKSVAAFLTDWAKYYRQMPPWRRR